MILDKVISNVFACGIEVAFTGDASPSDITGWQPFYNSIFLNATFNKAYASISSLEFGEESETSVSGVSYNQKVTWRFPENDPQRSERIALLHTIKYLKFKFTNHSDYVLGRNDANQNTKPVVKVSSNGRLCQVEVSSKSIYPSGVTPNLNWFGLPTFIPLTLNP